MSDPEAWRRAVAESYELRRRATKIASAGPRDIVTWTVLADLWEHSAAVLERVDPPAPAADLSRAIAAEARDMATIYRDFGRVCADLYERIAEANLRVLRTMAADPTFER